MTYYGTQRLLRTVIKKIERGERLLPLLQRCTMGHGPWRGGEIAAFDDGHPIIC